MIFKTWLTGLNDVQKAINNISTLNTTANGATHLFSNSAVVQQYTSALKGLNKEQVLLALSYKNLSTQQKEQILSQMGLIASENTIQSELLQTTLAQKGVSAEKSKAILIELGLMNAETGEILSQKACTKADLEAILAQKGITGAQAEGIISALGLSGANAGLTVSFGLLGKAIWGVTKALLSNPITWIVAGFVGLVAITDALTTSTEEYKEQLDDLKSEYSEITSQIESINSELETTKQRMDELEGKDSLTFTEKEEYDNLVKTNNELQRKIDLLQLEEKQKNKEKNKTFVDTMISDTEDPFEYEVDPDGKKTKGQYSISDEYLTSETGYIEAQFEIRDQLLEDLANAETEKEKERIQKRIDEIEKYLNDKNDEWKNVSDGISYIENPTTEDDKAVNEWLDYIADFQDRMAIAMSKDDASSNAQYKTNTFNRVVDNWQFDETVQGLQDLGKEGKVTAEMLDDPKYDEFINKLVLLGVIDSADNLEDVALAFNSVANSAENATDATGDFIDKTDIPSTFKSLWKSIGKGNDDTSKEAKSAKEEILKLAEAGKLTEKALKKSSLAKIFEDANIPLGEAVKKINAMVDSSKQLSALKSGMSAITSAYDEKKDAKDKRIGADTLNSMYGTLDIESWTDSDLKVWEQYKKVASDSTSTLKELKDAQDNLATSFVNSNNFLANITDGTYDYYVGLLSEMGVTNAAEVATQALNGQKIFAKTATLDLSNAEESEISTLAKYIDSLDDSSNALAYYTIQQQIANNNALDTSDSIENLKALAEQCGITGEAIKLLANLAANMKLIEKYTIGDGKNDRYAPDYISNAQSQADAIKKDLNKVITDGVKQVKTKTSKGNPNKDPKDSTDKKTSTKDTKQEIDWLSRRLSRMQSIIDLTASKLKNLFKIDEKENNINKQIKQTTKLINQYGHAYDVYMSKANKVAKASKNENGKKVPALSKDIINKIQSGEITKGDYKSLIKKYGKDYADKINEYIDYYDKAQDSLKNKEEQIANKRELKKSKIQLRIDDKQANIDLMEAKKENATSASDKNKILDDELKAYEKLYKEKKKLAEKDEDKTEIKRLEEEKKQKEKEIKIEKHQNNIDEKQSALDVLEAQKEIVTSAADKNAIIDQELALKREICNEELAIAKLNGDQNEQERLKKQLLFEEKKAQLEQIANTKDEFDLKKNALSRDEAKLQQQIAENEAKGVGQSVKDYRKQISLSEERQKELRDEKEYWEAQLSEQLASGKIVANESDAAYKELKDNIASCDEGISQCTVDQINWNKAIKEMDYKNYETLLDLLDMAYKKLENLRSIREAHGKELTNDEILKQIKIDDMIINNSKSAMESAKKNLSDAFKEGEYGFTLNTDQIDEFMDYLEYMPEQIPDLMKDFFGEDFDFNRETYSGIFEEIDKYTTANDSWVQALVDAEGRSDEIGQKIINHASEYLEALKKQKDYKDRIFAIEKAQYDLEKAKNNLTKKVWDGQQWVYTADTEAVQSAQEALDNTKFDNFTSAIEDMIDVLEKFIKDFNIYDDNGNMINKPESILSKDVLGEYTIVDIDKMFTDNGWDISKLSGLMSNIQYAVPNFSIPNINFPEIERSAMNQTVNYDKIELILPNITDASTGADLAKSFYNELKNLPSYAKQYDWNR